MQNKRFKAKYREKKAKEREKKAKKKNKGWKSLQLYNFYSIHHQLTCNV
jgi:hypothetical protein